MAFSQKVEEIKMNAEAALKYACENPDLLCVSGSKLYGTNRASSDDDFRGFAVPTYEYLLGVLHFNDMDMEGADHKIYSLKRFLDLVSGGDPQLAELFYCPKDKIVKISPIGEEIMALRPHIISNKIYSRISGYSYSEWRKACGVRLEISERTRTEDEVINDIRNLFHLEKDEIDEVIEILFSKKPRTLVPSTKNLGEKRKKEFEQWGYGVSSAAHSLRLMSEVCELMQTGFITFPRPNADFLRDIRMGKVKKEEVEKQFNEEVAKANEARNHSVLPDKPDIKLVNKTYLKVVKNFLESDERYNGY